jgi:hypothetical protein
VLKPLLAGSGRLLLAIDGPRTSGGNCWADISGRCYGPA